MLSDYWFAIQTNPQNEKKAAAELRRAGIRVYLPKRATIFRNRRTMTESVKFRPLLVGYLFIRFPDDLMDRRGVPQFGRVRKCQGVRDFVCSTNEAGERQPFAIPSALIALFMRRERHREFGRPGILDPRKRMAELRKTFKPGTPMRITADGPFLSFMATLVKLNSHERVRVAIDIFGRPTFLTLGVEDVEPIARHTEAA